MACFHPLKAFRSLTRKTVNGKSVINFNLADAVVSPYEDVELPCNQCIGCRVERSRQWALRCVHEASLFIDNCFVTLTFDNDNLNENGSLVKSDFQKFMKRLRKKYNGISKVVSKSGKISYPIRYFHCGEYGSQLSRPHHHVCLFNFDFPDKRLWSVRESVRLYRSESLEKLWPFGFCTIGNVNYQSAAYVARYVTKKVNGKMADTHYKRVDVSDGEVFKIVPEYITMSRRPGIGKRWFEQFGSDVFPKDFVTHDGKKFRPPKYYDNIYDSVCPDALEKIKLKRKLASDRHVENNVFERLTVRERVALLTNKVQLRSYEND